MFICKCRDDNDAHAYLYPYPQSSFVAMSKRIWPTVPHGLDEMWNIRDKIYEAANAAVWVGNFESHFT